MQIILSDISNTKHKTLYTVGDLARHVIRHPCMTRIIDLDTGDGLYSEDAIMAVIQYAHECINCSCLPRTRDQWTLIAGEAISRGES